MTPGHGGWPDEENAIEPFTLRSSSQPPPIAVCSSASKSTRLFSLLQNSAPRCTSGMNLFEILYGDNEEAKLEAMGRPPLPAKGFLCLLLALGMWGLDRGALESFR